MTHAIYFNMKQSSFSNS